MLFEEGDSALLKLWIVKRLEDISDADSDVLADYVLALLRHEQVEEEVKKLCIDQLDDFLREHTEKFVEDVFAALRAKSFLSVNSTLAGSAVSVSLANTVAQGSQQLKAPQLTPDPPQEPQENEEIEEVEEGVAGTSLGGHARTPPPHAKGQYSPAYGRFGERERMSSDRGDRNDRGQKRAYYERDRDGGRSMEAQYGPNSTSSRGFKAPRRGNERGGRWTRGDGGIGRGISGRDAVPPQPQSSTPAAFGQPQYPLAPGLLQTPPVPVMGPGFPWPEDPMTALLAMQAVTGWPAMPVFSPLPTTPPVAPTDVAGQRKPVEKRVGERCKDYDEKGYCMQGDMCPYEHGMDHIVIAGQEHQQSPLDEYDPNNSQLFPIPTPLSANGHSDQRGTSSRGSGDRGRGRGVRGANSFGRGGRSNVSSTGPNFDKSITTLVVENIPEDKLDETSIKAFFSRFGAVTEVNVQTWRRYATVKFERWEMAKQAYDSPAPIFDNRFVKVFWHRPATEQQSVQQPQQQQRGSSAAPASTHVPKPRASPPPQLSKLADEGEVDMEEFKRKSEEAQKAHEAKMARKKAHEEAMKELEKKKEELLRMEKEQKRILLEKLAKRKTMLAAAGANATSGAVGDASKVTLVASRTNGAGTRSALQEAATESSASAPTTNTSTTPTPSPTTPQSAKPTDIKSTAPQQTSSAVDSETEALRAQLEALEAEAKSLGIDQYSSYDDPTTATLSYRGRGRGVSPFRGGIARASYRGAGLGRGARGGYNPYVPPGVGQPYFRSRGGMLASRGRGGTMKLDNRTRKVSVGGLGVSLDESDEALRQYLLGIGEFEGIEAVQGKEGTVVVTFKDRGTAEKFVHAGPYIPNIGKVELGWINTPLPPVSAAGSSVGTAAMIAPSSTSTQKAAELMEEMKVAAAAGVGAAAEDYDLAEEDEGRWLAE